MDIPHRTMHVCTCRNDSLTQFAKINRLSVFVKEMAACNVIVQVRLV